LKKQWLTREFDNGYVFQRLDERAKVFIEYGPAEKSWIPVTAPNYMMIGCFWVSGKYKRKLKLQVIKLETMEEAQSAPTPATIISLFFNGKFVTTNISACMDSRFEKVVRKLIST